jgi:hypothetical protein
MGKATLICVFLVFALLLEDGSSVRKRTEEEEREDREMAEKVNATLAEEKKKEDEEKRRENEKKRKIVDQTKTEKEDKGKRVDVEDKDEACPTNSSCPTVEPCVPCEDCPVVNCSGQCKACPEVKPCPKCKDPEEPEECPPCEDCPPVRDGGPCPAINSTLRTSSSPGCLESPGMSTPVAMAVGAAVSLLVTGVATLIGLVIRYVPPTVSGLLFLAIIIIIWYLSSQYPATARELGGRAATLLREAAAALSHRIVDAIRHHNEQVGFS